MLRDSPARRRGLLHALVRLLALLLVPVVLVASPNVAQAATVYGDPLGFDVELSDISTNSFNCSGTAQWVVPTTSGLISPYVKTSNIKCGTTMLLGNQYDCDSEDCSNLEVTVSGPGCEAASTSNVVSGWVGNSGFATFASASITPGGTTCNVAQLCLSFDGYANNNIDWGADKSCVSYPLGLPPSPVDDVATCPTATMTGGNLQEWAADTRSPKRWQAVYKLKDVTGGSWNFGVILSTGTGSYTYQTQADPISLSAGQVTYTAGALDAVTEKPNVLGLYMINNASVYSDSASVHRDRPFTSWQGRGVQDPGQCRFYFGEKFWDDGNAATSYDTPGGPADGTQVTGPNTGTPLDPDAGPVPPEGDTVDEGCSEGFSIWKPASWVSAGWCEVVSGLAAVAREVIRVGAAIGKLPGKIVSGVSDFMSDAFVPADGYLDDRVSVTKSKLNDTTPGHYLTAFDDLVPGQVSGCEGVQIAPPMPGDQPGVMFDLQMGSACSGKMADIAGMVRLAISAAVVIGGGLACVRALGSGFGWSPSVGKGESV